MTTTEEIDAVLIGMGLPAECVVWVCDEHRRHCIHTGTEHDEHACYWCQMEQRALVGRGRSAVRPFGPIVERLDLAQGEGDDE